jgi:hypothetical protein
MRRASRASELTTKIVELAVEVEVELVCVPLLFLTS